MLKHDDQGFLIGAQLNLSKAEGVLSDIASDVSGIKNILTGQIESDNQGSVTPNNIALPESKPTREESTQSSIRDNSLEHLDIKPLAKAVDSVASSAQSFNDDLVQSASRVSSTPSLSRPSMAASIDRSTQRITDVIEYTGDKTVKADNKRIRDEKEKPNKEHTSPERGSDGRFKGEDGDSKSLSAIKSIGSKLIDNTNVDNIDPTIEAAKEVVGLARPVVAIATPIAKGAVSFFGRKKKKENFRLTKKIYRAIVLQSKEGIKWSKKHLNKLKEIEDKPSGSGDSGSGLMGMLGLLSGGLITGIAGLVMKPLAAMIGVVTGSIAGMASKALAGSALSRAGGVLSSPLRRRRRSSIDCMPCTPVRGGARDRRRTQKRTSTSTGRDRNTKGSTRSSPASKGVSSKVGNIGKGVAKRLPFLAALFAVNEIANNELSDLSRKQKTIENGKSLGGAGGAIAGGLSGAALGATIGSVVPVVGTAIGGAVGGALGAFAGSELGEAVGAKVGEWTNAIDVDAVNQGVTSIVNTTKEKISTSVESANTFIKEATGINVKETYSTVAALHEKAVDTITTKASDKFESIAESIKSATGIDLKAGVEVVDSVVNSTVESVKEGFSGAANWVGSFFSSSEKEPAPGTQNKSSNQPATPVKPKKVSRRKEDRWNDAKGYIVEAASKAGVSAGTLAKIANFESGFNDDARPIARDKRRNKITQFDGVKAISSAHGYGQFLDKTWMNTINKHGAKYGIKDAGKLTKKQAAKYRGDKKIQSAMLAEFTKENVEMGRKIGGKDDAANVYALHNLGSGDGGKFLKALKKNPNARVDSILSRNVISGNGSLYGKGNITVADAYRRMGNKMNAGNMFAQEANAMQQGAYAKKPPAHVLSTTQIKPVVTSVPAPNPIQSPRMPVMPVAANISKMINNSSHSVQTSSISAEPQQLEVGQDVSDRKIAHIVTGGIGGSLV